MVRICSYNPDIVESQLFLMTYTNDPSIIWDPDTLSYHKLSLSLFEHGKYERIEGTAETQRPPAYPLFLASNYYLFGESNLF